MGVVEDLHRAREAYERREWVAAYRALCDLDETEFKADDFAALATTAYLLGRRNDCVQALQRAYQASLAAGDRPAAVRAAYLMTVTLRQAGELAVGNGWHRPGRAAPGRACRRRGRAWLPLRLGDDGAHPRRRVRRGVPAGTPDHRLRPPLRRARPDRPRAPCRGPADALLGPGRGWPEADGRGVGRRDGRRGDAGDGRAGLLLDDRGLPGGLRLRSGRRVDPRADHVVRRPAGARRLYRPVCDPPRPAAAAARRVRRRGRGARTGC